MPLFVYDIWPDGRAEPVPDSNSGANTGADATGPGAYRWHHYDLSDPELAGWAARHLHPIPAAALQHSETRPRCDSYEDGLILNLRGVNLNPGQQSDQMVAIRIWVTQKTIVTARMRRAFALEEIRAACLEGAAPPSTASFLVALVGILGLWVRDAMLDIDATTEELELQHEDDDQPDPEASALTEPRRKVIRMLRYMQPQGEALTRLLHMDTPVLTKHDRIALREPVNLMELSVEGLTALKSRLEALQDAANAVATARLGRNSYGLSLVAAVFLPLGFVTGLFGVNVGGMPGLESAAAFALLCIGLTILGVGCVLVLKWLRLL